MSSPFAALPSVSALIAAPELNDVPHTVAVRAAREVLDEARARIRRGEPATDGLSLRVSAVVSAFRQLDQRAVINATGVVVHTNLGRAPLHPHVARVVAEHAGGYSSLEMRLDTGKRGGRLAGVRRALRELTGAEDAVVVNNNAAAVLLTLTALAKGREVVVSRGELVEIGGSFRVPDVISAGGARLVEVGTTNRTRVADFAAAAGPDTAVLLRVHPSNFRQVGFVERPDRAGLVALGRERELVVVEDLGSGLLGAAPEALPSAVEDAVDAVVATGVDLVCFSGDKLLGGPQAGIIVGRRDLIARLRAHPMYRALRLGKLGLVALEATLQLYREGRADEVPVRAMLNLGAPTLRGRAEELAALIPGARIAQDVGYSGGGAMPARPLPGMVVELEVDEPDALSRGLRLGNPSVVARVARGCVVLDPRTVLPGQVSALAAAVNAARVAGAET